MDKRQRSYSLIVASEEALSPVTVRLPFTLEFDVNRTYFSSANKFSIRLYNLSEKTRNKLRKDAQSYDTFREIKLQAGYGLNLPVILKGNVTQAWSYREGVNFISQIEGFDAGFAFVNGVTNTQYPSDITQKAKIVDMVSQLKDNYKVEIGAIGNYDNETRTPRGNSYSGNTTDILRDLTGGGFFIDNGVVHCLRDDESTDDKILIINSQSGLLGTPLLEQTIVHVNILFEPIVKIGQRILLESTTETRFKGLYKVTGIHHRGTISEAICGDAVTTLSLVNGQFNPVAPAVAQ